MCSDTLVEELAKNHAHGLQGPRNAKDDEELAIEDLEKESGQILILLLLHTGIVSERICKQQI